MNNKVNEGKFRVYHEGIDDVAPELGCVNLEVDPDSAVKRVQDKICAYDLDRNNAEITYNNVVYLEGYPKDCIHYSTVEPTKYYWNTVHKILYRRDTHNKQPWKKLSTEIFFVEGLPEELVYNPISGVYYCDTSIASRELQMYTWSEKDGWAIDKKLVQLISSPLSLGYDPETTDYLKLYFDMQKNELYELDPFVFLVEVNFTSAIKHLNQYVIYERPLAYIDEFHTKSFDVNNSIRIDFNDIIFISKDPNKYVKNPEIGKYYRDVKEEKWYIYNGTSFETLEEKTVKEFGQPIYVKGVPSEVLVETPKTDRPYVNMLSGIIYMFKDNNWEIVGTTELSKYHPSKDFY